MLPSDAGHTSEGRTAANNATVRTVFVVGPDKKIKLMLVYPDEHWAQLRRSRCGSSIPFNSPRNTTSPTPVNWKPGDDVIIPPAVSDDDAKKKFPQGWKTLKPYLG